MYVVIWPFMQYGVFLTIPVLTVVAVVLRRYRLAAAMAISGVGVYVLARLVKELVHRGRPEALISNIEARETFAARSLGYPSGHAAVAAALAVLLTPYLRGWWKAVPTLLTLIVCIGRMYVGAHTPLDLIGGVAIGVSAGSLAKILARIPSESRRTAIEGERDGQ